MDLAAPLSAPASSRPLPDRIAALERARRSAGITQAALAREAGVSERTYRRIVLESASPEMSGQKLSITDTKQEQKKLSTDKIGRFERALQGLASRRNLLEPDRAEILKLHRLVVAVLAPAFGVTAEDALAADPRAGATADPLWRTCRHVSQAATYLLNVGLGIRQRVLAEVLDLTPAAVCLALKAVEDRRTDPDFDAILWRAARLVGVERAM